MELSDKDWQMLIGALTREFGEDEAQDALVEMLSYLERRRNCGDLIEIENPLGLLRQIAKFNKTDALRSREGIVEIPLSKFSELESDGFSLPSSLHDTRDPFEIVAAREELEIIAQNYPELITAEGQEDIPEGMPRSTFFWRKDRAWHEKEKRTKIKI